MPPELTATALTPPLACPEVTVRLTEPLLLFSWSPVKGLSPVVLAGACAEVPVRLPPEMQVCPTTLSVPVTSPPPSDSVMLADLAAPVLSLRVPVH